MFRWLAIALALAAPATAQDAVLFSPDITANLGTAVSTLVEDDDVARDSGTGTVVIPPLFPSMLAALPAGAEIAAVETSNSAAVGILLAVDTAVPLPGLPASSPAEPRDVVRFDLGTGTFSIAFDGSVNSVPAGTRVDAVAANSSDQLLLSFDASGSVPGAAFDDEDVLAFATGPATWSKHFDGSTSDPTNWPAADLVALPEPSSLLSLVVPGALVALLARRSRASEVRSSTARNHNETRRSVNLGPRVCREARPTGRDSRSPAGREQVARASTRNVRGSWARAPHCIIESDFGNMMRADTFLMKPS